MKITNIRMVGTSLPVSHVALLQVETNAGVVGIGATSAPIHVIAALVTDLLPLLLGKDPSDPGHLWRLMFEGWQAQRGRGGEGGVALRSPGGGGLARHDDVRREWRVEPDYHHAGRRSA